MGHDFERWTPLKTPILVVWCVKPLSAILKYVTYSPVLENAFPASQLRLEVNRGVQIGKPKHSILYFTIQNETLVVGGVASFAQQRRIDDMRPQDMFEDAQKTLTKVK